MRPIIIPEDVPVLVDTSSKKKKKERKAFQHAARTSMKLHLLLDQVIKSHVFLLLHFNSSDINLMK